jgi:hypothetical protein
MAKLQNVTLTLPEDLVREARHLAVDRGVSLSRYLACILEEQIESKRQNDQARQRLLRLLEEGLPSSMPDPVTWTRDELHER